ncbi:hypothetical protein EDD85DRAFT_941268 [Armillaria nabsnona]|nr:hypothetical protein EDD85DRAFT_941268 [Armillaria nabsnona]
MKDVILGPGISNFPLESFVRLEGMLAMTCQNRRPYREWSLPPAITVLQDGRSSTKRETAGIGRSVVPLDENENKGNVDEWTSWLEESDNAHFSGTEFVPFMEPERLPGPWSSLDDDPYCYGTEPQPCSAAMLSSLEDGIIWIKAAKEGVGTSYKQPTTSRDSLRGLFEKGWPRYRKGPNTVRATYDSAQDRTPVIQERPFEGGGVKKRDPKNIDDGGDERATTTNINDSSRLDSIDGTGHER